MNQTSLSNTQKPFLIDSIPGISALWSKTLGDKNVRIAIIDGNVDRNHSCFKEVNIQSVDVFNSPVRHSRENVALEHGTSVASIIFGAHNSEVKGIAPCCTGIIIPAFSKSGNGQTNCSQLDLARAIQVADAKGAHVINISGGEFSASGKSEVILANAIQQCIKKGIIIVSAVGNDGCECLHVPAAERSVLAVGAMDANNDPLNFSNWGKAYRNNGILFPGKDILAAAPGNGTVLKTGTSFASAIASGVSALLLSAMIKAGLKPNGNVVFDALLKTATPCNKINSGDCEKTLVGYLNLPGAIREVLNSSLESTVADKSESLMHPLNKPGFYINPSAYLTNYSAYSINQFLTNSNIKKKERKTMSHVNETIEIPASAQPGPGNLNAMPDILHPSGNPGAGAVNLSDCGCGCQKGSASQDVATTTDIAIADTVESGNAGNGATRPAMTVYAIGALGYEFRSEASRDSFQQAMNASPYDPQRLLQYLEENPEANEDVLWTLNLDSTPIYMLFPMGAFAESVYKKIRDFYRDQLAGTVARVSIPGTIIGKATLMTGQDLPVISPKGQGIFSWSTKALVDAIAGSEPLTDDAKAMQLFTDKKEGLENFLERVYYELRNLGITSQERALNFAATNAFQMDRVFEKAAGESLELDTIDVDKSPICKPGSDCWDVKLIFFNPEKRIQQARRIYRFTIDVSNVIPVAVGGIRSWNIY